jgi:hypothetical protein
MDPSIIALIFAILMIVTHIIKTMRENAEAAKQQKPDTAEDEVVVIRPNKPIKQQQKPDKPRLADRQPSKGGLRSVFDEPKKGPPRQALVKTLSTQGEGHRFVADPGTLDTSSIVAPTIDPTVKADLGSMTGIYEQQSAAARAATRRTAPTVEVNLLDGLMKPEGLCQAIIFAEIMNRPAWIDTAR